MLEYRVKMQVRATGYITVKAKSDVAAMQIAEDRVNCNTESFVGNADFVEVDVAECEELGAKSEKSE